MDVDDRGLDGGAGNMDGAGDYSNDAGRDDAGEDDYLDASEAAGDSGIADTGEAAEPAADMCAEPAHSLDPADMYEIDPSPHSLLSVLFPANPPRPRNARIIRLFDVEAKNDGDAEELPVVEQPREEPRSREAIRAARNQSLMVAARLRLE